MFASTSSVCSVITLSFFFFNDTATTEIYTLSLHDALPICVHRGGRVPLAGEGEPARLQAHLPGAHGADQARREADRRVQAARSEEHTSELQSRQYLVCRLLLEKKKKN